MSRDTIPSQEGIIKMLPPDKRKAYRERFRYWTKLKGLDPDAAHIKAIEPITNIVNIDGSAFNEASGEAKEHSQASESDLFLQQADSRRIPASAWHCLQLLPLLAFAIMVSYLLISASVQVFGHSILGYAKSIALEAGILFLSLSGAKSWYERAGKRMTAAIMIALSFFVLHSGAALTTDTNIRTAITNDSEISLLRARHDRLVADYDRLPENFLTKRSETQKELSDLEGQITDLHRQAKNSASVSVIQKVGMSETLLRACLLVLNLFLCHELVRRFNGMVKGGQA